MFTKEEKNLLWNSIVLSPLLIYIGIKGTTVSNTVYGVVLGLGILTFLYNFLTLVKSVTPKEAFEQKISFKR
jgi:hypothetical protein